MDELLDVMQAGGVAAVNIIPDRNWNIKDPEVDRLAQELAERLGTNKTDAVRRALAAELEGLGVRRRARADRLLDVMRTEIWPLAADRRPVSKAEREEILGYDPEAGV